MSQPFPSGETPEPPAQPVGPDGAATLHRLIEAMPLGAVVFRRGEGESLILAFANAAASRLSGIDLAARVGQAFAAIFPIPTLPDALLQAAESQTATRLSPILGPDGRAFAIDLVPLGDRAVGALFGEIAVHQAAPARQEAGGSTPKAHAGGGEPAAPAATAVPAAKSKGGTILVIDDEPLVGRLVERALGRGHRVTAVVTGREGLDKVLAGEVFDLILCDLMMPELTGMDLYDCILAHSAAQADRMVFLTGGAFTQRARDFLEKRPYLEKPFDLSALEALVRAHVG